MPEDAYGHWDSGPHSGSSPIRAAASNTQLDALTNVLYKMGIFSDHDKLLTISELLGRQVSVFRGIRRDEADDLMALLGIQVDLKRTTISTSR